MARFMRHRSSSAAIFCLLVATFKINPVVSQGAASCPSGFTYVASVNGCYQLIQQQQTWQNATAACAALAPGAHLAWIDSINENQELINLVKPSAASCTNSFAGLGSQYWLGAQRADPTYRSDFYWKSSATSGPVSGIEYDNFNGGQPDYAGYPPPEACMELVPNWSNHWNDAPCSQTFCSICEVDVPVPAGQYCIRVYTSNIGDGGTQAKVYITLRGTTNSSEYNLYNSAFDSFAQNQVSLFCLAIPSVGPLTGITIRHDGTGGAPGWFLDKVVVLDQSQTYTFPAFRWLATDELDKSISTDLTIGRQNLAYLKPTWQSSTYAWWGSNRAVDGVKDRMANNLGYCQATDVEWNAWWAVDLGSPAFVDYVQITIRTDGLPEQNDKYIVGLTNTPPTLKAPVPVPSNYYICNTGPQVVKLGEYDYFRCQRPANQPPTRYVVVQLNQTNNYLTMCEVEVFGTLDTSACSSNPCHNGGTCISQGATSFNCVCLPGYTGPTCNSPGCPDGFIYASSVNGCYKLLIKNQAWADAAAQCASLAPGGHLAFVGSDLEQAAIANIIADYYATVASYSGPSYTCQGDYFGLGPEWWLGGQRSDPKTQSTFVWKTSATTNTSSPLVYTNWNPGNPDYCCGGESCMTTITNWQFKWNDAPCDTQVFCGVCEYDMPNSPVVNLALKQPTTSSSMYSNWASTLAVDGNKQSNAGLSPGCFATNNEANAWWAVDLGTPAFVSGVQLVVRSDCCTEQSSNIYIGLTNIAPSLTTPPQYPSYDICAKGPLLTSLNDVYLVECATGLPAARYVVLQNDGPQFLSMCEVEVYGLFISGPCATMPCQNGGTCANSGTSFTCACAVGWTGANCSTAATNLALSKSALQSSTYGTWSANLAVDGNPNPAAGLGSCAVTNFDVNPWWIVDLGAPTFIQGVKLVNRDASPEREDNFIVGLTNMNPSLREPHPTSYTVGICGQGMENTLASQSYWVRCAPNLPSARYVVIQVETQTYLQICELYVYGQQDTGPCSSSPCVNGGLCINTGSSYTCTCAVGFSGATCANALTNLALNKPAFQSSTYGTWAVGYGNDGSLVTTAGKCALTNADWSAWWAVDLGSPVYVQGVMLLPRGDCCGNQDNQFTVGLTNVPPTQNLPDPTNYVTCGNGPKQSDTGNSYYILCAANQAPARFVVIQLPSTPAQLLGICELQVYGTPDTSACNSNPCRNGGTCIPTAGGFACQCFVGWTGSTCSLAALNVALGRPTAQSSTYGSWVSARAVDGNRASAATDSGSCSATTATAHPWWSVDLGQPTYVQGVLFAMSNVAYLGDPNWVVTIGLTNVPTVLKQPTPAGGYVICGKSISAQVASALIYIMCAPNLPAFRYVTVQFEKVEYLRVCELEVYNGQGPCGSNPCSNGGNCTNSGTGFTCVCAPGYTGTSCSQQVDPCASSPCLNGGQCTSSGSTYTCTCASGWTGANCQTQVDPCSSSPCLNGGQCTSSGSVYTCTCASGWTGTNCQTKVDPCASSPCLNGGQCTSSSSTYTCTCASGWTGTNCQTKVDPCASSPCLNGGQCTSSGNVYTCTCASGWTGTNCQTKVDPCASSPCLNGGQCVSSGSTYTCTCASGWTGTNCQTKVDPCASSPCLNGGQCTSSGSTYTCTCASGWTGTNCQTKVDPCASSPCLNGGQCTSSGSSYTCTCASGWTGTNCQTKVDPCASSPCLNGGQCTSSGNVFTCTCASGWTGTNCQTKVDPCASSPCLNGGQCISVGGGVYTCSCASGWTGTNCQTNSNPCSSNPCANGGNCTSSGSTFTCTCVAGWGGSTCNTDLNVCLKKNPCQHGGVCNKLGDGYFCACPTGYAGMNCEINQDGCTTFPDSSRINCGWGGVTNAQCNNMSCCFEAAAQSRGQAVCYYTKESCADITKAQRVDCYMPSPTIALYCYQRGCCWDPTLPTTGLQCYRQAARQQCIGVPANKRIPRANPGGMPNNCESIGACWDSSLRDQKNLWCFDIAP